MIDLTAIWQRYVKSALGLGIIVLSIYAVYAYSRINSLSQDNSELTRLSGEYAAALQKQEQLALVTDITMLARAQFSVEVVKKAEKDINEITTIQRNVYCADVPVPDDVTELMRRAVAATNNRH